MRTPSEDFVRYFAQRVYSKKVTANVLFQFSDLVKRSVNQVISDMITDRLKSAIDIENVEQQAINNVPAESPELQEAAKEKVLETTSEEMEAFFVVKSILRTIVGSHRITHRDAQTYFSVLLDDNNRKTICRLYFNSSKKYIGTFDAAKKETKNEIQSLDDIYNYSEALKATVETYLGLGA